MTQHRLYVRVLVAAAAAALTGGAGWLFSLSLPETFILSVFVAGVVLVVQLLNQFDQQLIAMQAVVTGRFSEVSWFRRDRLGGRSAGAGRPLGTMTPP